MLVERKMTEENQALNPVTPQPSVQEGARDFFASEERILSDIAGSSRFTFKQGDEWAINPETGETTYDPKFFEERGYTPSQALFAAFHEIKCHLVETAELIDSPQGEDAYQRLKTRQQERSWVHIWENCRTDAKGNQVIIGFAPALAVDTETLYREKLWPETDFTTKPRHLQFMYAVLRTAMVPNEQVVIAPEVQEAIDKLRNVKGKDVIALATDPTLDPLLALRLSERYIEPVIEELYQKDREEQQQSNQSRGQEQSQSQGQGNSEPFEADYEDFENRHPEPFDEDEIEKKIKEVKSYQDEATRQEAGYEGEHGVSKKDAVEYYSEYKYIEPHIEPLRERVFRRLVEQRKIPIRRLRALKEEGVMIDPGLVAQTYMDVQSGIENPRNMKEFEGHLIDENIPSKFTARFVADQSTSMAENGKNITQRRAMILGMEALKEFTDMLDEEGEAITVDLDVQTELRSFGVSEGTKVYKPLSKELTERQRIEFFKGLLETSGGTNDYDALAEIEKDIRQKIALDSEYASELKRGKRREIVIVTSDGDSGNVAETQKRCKSLRELGVKVIGLGMTSDAEGIKTTYAPDGQVCYDVNDMPKVIENLLSDILGDLSVEAYFEGLKGV